MSLRERKKLAAWRAISEAALRLFEEQGFEATTIEQIAAAANVSRATFFNYFASKEAVVFDQDPEARDRWRALLESRSPGEPLWDSLAAIISRSTPDCATVCRSCAASRRSPRPSLGPARHPENSCAPICRPGSWPRPPARTR